MTSKHVKQVHSPLEGLTYLSNEVLETIPRQLGISVDLRLGQVGSQNVHAHLEVRLIEVIRDVPAELAVLASLLDYGVEEREHEDER